MDQIERLRTIGGHTIDNSQPAIPASHRTFGNPAPLGLFSFGAGFLCASLFNLNVRGIVIPNVVIALLIFYGGLMQTLVGMWEIAAGNTFGGTVFASYGAFNFSYAALYLPDLGIGAAYGTDSAQFGQAVGIYLWVWFCITVLFIIGALRSSGAVLSVLVFTGLSFGCLAGGQTTGSVHATTAGGAFGICASFAAWYTACCGFYVKDSTYAFIRLPAIDLTYKDPVNRV